VSGAGRWVIRVETRHASCTAEDQGGSAVDGLPFAGGAAAAAPGSEGFVRGWSSDRSKAEHDGTRVARCGPTHVRLALDGADRERSGAGVPVAGRIRRTRTSPETVALVDDGFGAGRTIGPMSTSRATIQAVHLDLQSRCFLEGDFSFHDGDGISAGGDTGGTSRAGCVFAARTLSRPRAARRLCCREALGGLPRWVRAPRSSSRDAGPLRIDASAPERRWPLLGVVSGAGGVSQGARRAGAGWRGSTCGPTPWAACEAALVRGASLPPRRSSGRVRGGWQFDGMRALRVRSGRFGSWPWTASRAAGRRRFAVSIAVLRP